MMKSSHVFNESDLLESNPVSSSASTQNERDRGSPIAQPPWFDLGCQLISWWDVEQFSAEHFMALTTLLERISVKYRVRHDKNPELQTSESDRQSIEGDLRLIERDCKQLGLVHTADALFDFRNNLLAVKHGAFTSQKIHWKLDEISDSLRREMKRSLFLHIPKKQAEMYEHPLKEWEPTPARFPDAILNIEEGMKCFALDRYGAAVAHMMLVAEFGAIEVGKLVELNDPKPGWQSVSRELKRIVQTDAYSKLKPIEQKHFKLLEQLLPLMLAMQDAWRHKIDHAANQLILLSGEFQNYVAEDIISATRAFMRRLANAFCDRF